MAEKRSKFSSKCTELDEELPKHFQKLKDGRWEIRNCSFDKDDSKNECSADCLVEKTDNSSD